MAARIGALLPDYPYFVAETSGEIAGYAYGSAFRERPAYRFSAEVTVYVSGSHQGQGLGRALYEMLIPALADQGRHMLIGINTLPNAASVALHEAMGFAPAGVLREVGWKGGRWHDTGYWQRRVGGQDG